MDINYNGVLPNIFKKEKIDFEDCMLIDIGCSGGIESYWQSFGEKLNAIGFDPLVSEIERLNTSNKNPKVYYEEGFITYHNLEKVFPKVEREAPYGLKWSRTSASAAAQAIQYNYAQNHFNDGKEMVFSKNFLELDEYLEKKKIPNVDFLKIDTDGSDFHVLLGAKETLQKRGVLGIMVEAQFHGSTHEYANTFSNIDIFLRKQGFTLFKFPTYTYTSAALPGVFMHDIFAQTRNGSIQFGDAVYFRDLADKQYNEKNNFNITRDKLVKLLCLLEMFKLEDHAAELILNRQKELGFSDHLQETLLNGLTPRFQGKRITYKEYMDLFQRNPQQWFASQNRGELILNKFKEKILKRWP